jgi:hypothetical protein
MDYELIEVGDVVKFKLGATLNGASTKNVRRGTWYGLVTQIGYESCKVKWFDSTYWMNRNKWVNISRLENMSVSKR